MLEEEALARYGARLARPVAESADVVLKEHEETARQRAQDAVASIFLRADAQELADLLAGHPLADAEAAHAPFQMAVNAAEKAVTEARSSWRDQTMELMRSGSPEPGTAIPTADSTAVDQAWQSLKDAQNSAEATGKHLRAMREKIERLRAIPKPDPADIAILARVLAVGTRDDGNE